MYKVNSILEAFDFVNQRYVFNSENYPVMEKLNADEQKVFSLKHTLLHMQKNINEIGIKEEAGSNAEFDADYRKALVKMIINLMKLADVLAISKHDFCFILIEKGHPVSGSPLNVCNKLMTQIAIDCEDFDHNGGIFDDSKIKKLLQTEWGLFQGNFSNEKQKLLIEQAYTYIPDFMKSK